MNVVATDGDPLERAHVVPDELNEDTDADKGDEESHRGNKHALAGPVGDSGAN